MFHLLSPSNSKWNLKEVTAAMWSVMDNLVRECFQYSLQHSNQIWKAFRKTWVIFCYSFLWLIKGEYIYIFSINYSISPCNFHKTRQWLSSLSHITGHYKRNVQKKMQTLAFIAKVNKFKCNVKTITVASKRCIKIYHTFQLF